MNLLGAVTNIIDDLIIKQVTAQVITVLGIASLPLIGPFLVGFVSALIKLGLAWALEKTILKGTRVFLAGQIDWEVADVEKAKAQLQDLLDNPSKYTDEQMAEIEKSFDEKAVALIHLVNARIRV